MHFCCALTLNSFEPIILLLGYLFDLGVQADIGLATGIQGMEVAKEFSDIIMGSLPEFLKWNSVSS